MTIAVYDTNTGTALTVHEVAAALDHTETPMAWAEEIDAWHIATRGRTFTTALSEMRAAMQLAGDRLDELGIGGVSTSEHAHRWVSEPELQPVFAELPPDPALELAPERLDAEHAQAMAIQSERRRRMAALAPIGQRTAIVSVPFVPRVPRPPWSRRVRTWASGWAEWLKPSGGGR